ncbi:Flagellar hook-associated protein FliD [Rhodovulum sp. PH10]|uniref:flagellin N-terminal helical domain-containing protein n=1 Tax=Rhodovulum sp. PH10 TaxID=1187851 RepID=UPI00027C20C4|nr:flagellin [Rhodovulum sp. PH10]EJW09644.1 Flagellar hook-associated protein FliD [Rhodovulum sp. PH10]
MSSNITLSAGVRQNLLSLQNTADLMATTQNRLATGKKVNSALDNPSNFFTSQSLGDRAGDLNSLLDSIGQAIKTIEAANNGITSLTKLVQSAKSIAQQARSATAPTITYDALNVTGSIPTETIATTTAVGPNDLQAKPVNLSFTNDAEILGTVTGTADVSGGPGGPGAAGVVQIRVVSGGVAKTFDVNLAGTEADFNATKAVFDATTSGTPGDTLDNYVTIANDGSGHLELTAANADVDFSISAAGSGSTAATLTAVGFTAGAHDSTSLFDNIVAQGGAQGSTFALSITGQDTQTVTFGTGAGQISTLAEFNGWLNTHRGAATASISGTTFAMSLGAGTDQAIGITASDVGVAAALGLDAATANYNFGTGARGGMGTALTKSFNSELTLAEIDNSLANGTNISLTIDANDGNGGQTQTVGLAGTDNLDDVIAKLKGNATIAANLDITNVAGKMTITAKTADVDFNIASGTATTALNLTPGQYNSTSLLDQIVAGASGGAEGDTLTVAANGGFAQTITFGKGTGQVSTRAEFTQALANLSGVTASVAGNAYSIQVAQGTSQTTLTIGGSTNTLAKLGTSAQTKTGTKHEGANNATRESLQKDYNDVLMQIDNLSKDASYNGINLLNGDQLKITFNERGTSNLTVEGVTYIASNLGLNQQNGNSFQDNSQVDQIIDAINNALTTLRTQASKFGANLSTVQTRQDFTKNMVNTLQTGADSLVLADSNEEGANMLALQTRQQLSTTALSLANQANQAVLRLFG